MENRLSLNNAKKFSILKWKAIINERETPKGLSNFVANCGFCERWKRDRERSDCSKCEFEKIAGNCFDHGSLYHTWEHNEDPTDALAILEAIKSIEVPKLTFYQRVKDYIIYVKTIIFSRS